MRKWLKTFLSILVIFILCVISASVSLKIASPYTSDDAMRYIDEAGVETNNEYRWKCPNATGYGYTWQTLTLDVSEEDFEKSMNRYTMRRATVLYPVAVSQVDPNNKYVQEIVKHIQSLTEGYSDERKILAARSFVQMTIAYAHDDVLYGSDEDFWASPTDTLYLRKGDCEDTSVLLASILTAMGYECAILDYESHNAVGVKIPGEDEYRFCETTKDLPNMWLKKTLTINGEYPDIYPVDYHKSLVFLDPPISLLNRLLPSSPFPSLPSPFPLP